MRRVKKSRNGCARCKSKRVKCGEEKPNCNRCTRLGVRCPGYAQSLRWVTKYEERSPVASPTAQIASPRPSVAKPHPSPLLDEALSASETPADFNHGQPESHHDKAQSGFEDLDGNICDNLWGLPDSRSLPELPDLCPLSPRTQPRDPAYDLTSSGDTAAELASILSLIEPPYTHEDHPNSVYPDFAPSTIVRSYPPMARQPHQRDFMSISRPLNNPSWTLIEYYFKEVAALFSSYDSQMNPFRTTVSRLWGSSLAMCRTMQSMAAATLVNDFPQFGPIGRKMRDEAVEIITREAVMDDKSLLALLMLGQTASWHDPKDLGISFFNILRKEVRSIGSKSSSSGHGLTQSGSNNYRFFEEALIYWEMLLSFVADSDSMMFSEDFRHSSTEGSFLLQRVPHPWTGIARDTQFTVHEVGRLVRRERKRIRSRNFTSQSDLKLAQAAIEKAQELEERLLNLAHPTEAEIVSPGDDETPVWHLLTMAEVYRCTGLMQLYRVFPDLLRNRLRDPAGASNSSDPFFPVDLDSMNLSGGFSDAGHETPRNGSQSISSPHINIFPSMPPDNNINSFNASETSADTLQFSWLLHAASYVCRVYRIIIKALGMTTLKPLGPPDLQVPQPTGRSFQGNTKSSAEESSRSSTELPGISMEAIEVSQTRKFILGRLSSFLHVLPPKPINVCIRLVKEVWRRMDAGETDTYWIDVMIEKKWETTMG
ncbi:Aflatoxin biosynthesis regulatory protein [Penicillium chermesinum]|uniref:Aflatoxin biosynthesis regulatory protein n=1 Tax=Penicillium chermesinum TaxID=63820 RepID=A0A9W9PIX8_9EURO|nr:Aflatoxin biosynthesis regulatory protein [Penicillium chermesinum]KAJ5247684.1 Aflatoxin biosynthesis regulatory protein [Penicillium chermesinum]